MKKFAIAVDTRSARFLEQIRSGKNVLCDVHIQIGEESFPSDPWLDFPVIILTWWLQGYLKLITSGEPVENTFMNGPFEFIASIKGDRVTLAFWMRTLTGKIEMSSPWELRLEEYRNRLIEAAEHLLNALKNQSTTSLDVKNLKMTLDSIRQQA